MTQHRIAIFASGSGTNAENIAVFFQNHPEIKVVLTLTNNPQAGVISRMKKLRIPCLVFSGSDLYYSGNVMKILKDHRIDFIVLAGFLLKIPSSLLQAFPWKIVNIHPALLPKYGGKGMYGMNVHEAVKVAGEKQTGITIHYLNENYDEGQIIFQAVCEINPETDTAESIAEKVHQLEYQHYPKIIEKILTEINSK